MSSFEFLPGEPATRWQMPALDGGEALPRSLHTAQQLDELEAEAHREGFARGHAEGYAEGQRKAQAEAARLRALIEHVARPLQRIEQDAERALVALTIEVARRLVQQELALDPAKVLGVVQGAIAALAGPARDVRVLVHPDDVALLRERLEAPAEAREFRIVAAPDLQRGECRIATENAQVDARLDTRQASVAQALLGDES